MSGVNDQITAVETMNVLSMIRSAEIMAANEPANTTKMRPRSPAMPTVRMPFGAFANPPSALQVGQEADGERKRQLWDEFL